MTRALLMLILGALFVSLVFPAPVVSNCDSALCRMVTAGGRDTRLDHFYQPTGYAFAWTLGGKATDQARALIETFREQRPGD